MRLSIPLSPASPGLLALSIAALSLPCWSQVGTLTTVNGKVVDLTLGAGGDLLYCTETGDAGRISNSGTVTAIATPADFPNGLRGIAELPGGAGDLAVIDGWGDIYHLFGGTTPATQVYSDLYMVRDATDFLVDVNGTHVVTSQSPTSGVKAINWISADGQDYAYYLVGQGVVSIAADPSGDLIVGGIDGGGRLMLIDAGDESHPFSVLDGTTQPGFDWAQHNGDIAVEADGNFLFVSGGTVWRHDRGAGTSSQVASGLGELRGIAIAASSGGVPSASGWSAYLASGSGPTTIRELGNVGGPAEVVAADLGEVPDRGTNVTFILGQTTYEMTRDLDGHLLVGGDHWTGNKPIQRIELPSFTASVVADSNQGLDERIEGIHQARDGTIYAAGHFGKVWSIREDPLQVQLHYDDAQDAVTVAKDLLVGRRGELYLSDRIWFGGGQVVQVSPQGVPTPLVATAGTRGLWADPFTAAMYVVEWHCIGFCGTVGRLSFPSHTISPVVGFDNFNLANDDIWADGDLIADVEGNLYVCSEDDWSVHRFDTKTGKRVRIASGYLDRPSGLAIARSSLPSTTGWSLYVSEYNHLWEIPDVPAPAPDIPDPEAPPVGRLAGYFAPSVGQTRAMVADPAGGGLLISTSTGTIERLRLSTMGVSTVSGPAQGLFGDLTAMDLNAAGNLIVANRSGVVFKVNTGGAWIVTAFFNDPLGQLEDVRGLVVDGQGRILLIDRPAGLSTGRTWLLDGGVLTQVGHTSRGVHPAIDPLTGDVFITEQGRVGEDGEVLRMDTFASPATAGHWRGDEFQLFDVGELSGGMAFDDAGNFYLCAGDAGRIERLERSSGSHSTLAGGYQRPRDVVLALGTAGTAGPEGTSLFVLDEWAVFEVGVTGTPASGPPATPPGLAPPADLVVQGTLALGGATPLAIHSPAEAGLPYLIIPSFSGKVPGLPLSILGNPLDTRVLPINIDALFAFINTPGGMDAFVSILDGNGDSPPILGLTVPNNPVFSGLDLFMDFAWMAFEPLAPNGIQKVGGTAQLYFGL